MGYHNYWNSAEKKGYSGVAVFTKQEPSFYQIGNGYMQSDAEGRVIRLDFGDITLINAYFPSGTSGEIRQSYKYIWLDEFLNYLDNLRKERPHLIICGDYNIAHKEIDIHDPKGNKNNTGFLPEERAWMDKFFQHGYIDTFRQLNQNPGQYSWWSQRFPTVRLNNKGWRIDYINVTENLKDKIKDARIMPDVKHSDHCPVYLELEF
jgi:exodeoxyribonuclease-3